MSERSMVYCRPRLSSSRQRRRAGLGLLANFFSVVFLCKVVYNKKDTLLDSGLLKE